MAEIPMLIRVNRFLMKRIKIQKSTNKNISEWKSSDFHLKVIISTAW